MKYNPTISIHPNFKQVIKNILLNGVLVFALTWLWFVLGIVISTYISWQNTNDTYIFLGLVILYIALLFSKIKIIRDYHLSFIISFIIGLLFILLAFIIDFFFGYESVHILIYYVFGLVLGSLLLCEITKTKLQFTILYILQAIVTSLLILRI